MKNGLQILGGVVGGIVGYVGVVLLLGFVGFGNRSDPIATGLLTLFGFGPAGAIAGLLLGTRLAMLIPRSENTGSFSRNSLKAFAALVALCAAAGAAYYVYAVNTATPWLNPNAANPTLRFEIRLPAGATPPTSAGDVAIELQTDVNTMPGEPRLNPNRRDDENAVIAGQVDLAFRTAHRQLQVRIKGQPDRVYPLTLPAKPPHATEFGPWQSHPGGSEIRYRVQWPGRD